MSPLSNWTRPVAGLIILGATLGQEVAVHAAVPKHVHVDLAQADATVLQRHEVASQWGSVTLKPETGSLTFGTHPTAP